MTTEFSSHTWRKHLMSGLVLVIVGAAFALDQRDLVDLRGWWHYWPLLMVLSGINRMIGYPSAKDFSGGAWSVMMGLWLFAALDHQFGLTIWNSWPLPVIACGISMMLEPLVASHFPSYQESRNEK